MKLAAAEAVESQGQLSPDGKWLAYAVAESGGSEIYLRTVPAAAASRVLKVSIDGGAEPRWRADGKEIYYVDPEVPRKSSLFTVAVQLSTGGELHIETPQRLFEVPAQSQRDREQCLELQSVA